VFLDEDLGSYLYHYTTAEAFLAYILPNRQLKMSTFVNVNDPFESRRWACSFGTESVEDLDILKLTSTFNIQVKGAAKVLCFAQDDVNYPGGPASRRINGRGCAHPSMWERYAGGHTGVCLVFDKAVLEQDVRDSSQDGEILFGDGVTYRDIFGLEGLYIQLDALDDRSILQTMRDHQITHAKSFYFTKARDWRTECEFRWVVLTPSAETNTSRFVDIRRSLRGVILGDQFPFDAIPELGSALEGQDILLVDTFYMNGSLSYNLLEDTSAAAVSERVRVRVSIWGGLTSLESGTTSFDEGEA
jgi:hypothetical protein